MTKPSAARLACALTLLSAGTLLPTAALAAPAGAPVATAPPQVSGETIVGRTLHATHATWTNQPTSYTDYWMRCSPSSGACKVIDGADGLDYTLTAADTGNEISFGEIATNASGDSDPSYSANTGVVLARAPITFRLVSRSGVPQFAYFIVESGGRRPAPADWLRATGQTAPVGVVKADVAPGQTIFFSPTSQIGVRLGRARSRTPEGPHGLPYHVTATTPARVRVVMPGAGPAFHPALSLAELRVLGQLNRRRRARGERPLRVSRILDQVASAEARDEALRHRWPDPMFWALPSTFGWPGDLSTQGLATADAPFFRPARVLRHWDGDRRDPESRAIWRSLSQPYLSYVGIADGGGAWIIIAVSGCPAATNPRAACGLTDITGP